MTAVPRHLIFGDFLGGDERQSVVLPFVKATAHGINLGIPKVLKCFCCECRTGTAGTIDDDRLVAIGQRFFGFYFQKTAREENRFFEMTLFPLIAFAHIKKSEAIGWIEFILNF